MTIAVEDQKKDNTWQRILIVEGGLRTVFNGGIILYIASVYPRVMFGELSLLLAITAIYITLSKFGMDNLLVSRLRGLKRSRGITLASSLIIRIGMVLACGPAFAFFIYLQTNTLTAVLFMAVMTLAIPTHFETLPYVDGRLKLLFAVKACSLFVTTLIKISIVLSGGPISFIFLAYILEYALLGIGLSVYTYRISENFQTSSFVLKRFSSSALPFSISALTVILYSRTDQLMLGWLADFEQLAEYAIATRIVEASFFIAPILANQDIQNYAVGNQQQSDTVVLYRKYFYIGATIGLLCTSLAFSLQFLLYSGQYEVLGMLTAILASSVGFVFLGVISGRIFGSERLQSHILGRSAAGLFVNIFANFFLIQTWGHIGAAVATLISQFSAVILYDLLIPRLHNHYRMKLAGVFFL